MDGSTNNLVDAGDQSGSRAPADRLLALWFENSPLGVTLTRTDDGTFRVNRAFADMLGHTVEELREHGDPLRLTHPDDVELDRLNVERLLAGDAQSLSRWDKRFIHADGRIVWARVTLFLARHDDGTPDVLVAQIEDLTFRRELERRLEVAERDGLTGLSNRVAFELAAADQVARSRRYGERAALMLLDLDHLKEINDTHGHLVGDEALRTVAGAVRRRLRASDLAARLGGDEFVVLLPHTTRDDAQRLATEIEGQIELARITAPAGAVHLTASIGVAPIDAATPDLQAALRDADLSMYARKRRRDGRGPARD